MEGLPTAGELLFEQANRVAQGLVYIDASELRRRHLGEVAEATNDTVEIGQFRF